MAKNQSLRLEPLGPHIIRTLTIRLHQRSVRHGWSIRRTSWNAELCTAIADGYARSLQLGGNSAVGVRAKDRILFDGPGVSIMGEGVHSSLGLRVR